MFCADSSSWIAYLSGASGEDIEQIDSAPARSLSPDGSHSPGGTVERSRPSHARRKDPCCEFPFLELTPGFWERAGKTRASLIRLKMKPKLADTLIAQVCMDHKVTLHTRDTDFRPFVKYGLQLRLHGVVN